MYDVVVVIVFLKSFKLVKSSFNKKKINNNKKAVKMEIESKYEFVCNSLCLLCSDKHHHFFFPQVEAFEEPPAR